MSVRAILFDLDGTLRHSVPSGYDTFLDILTDLGYRLDDEQRREGERWTHFYWSVAPEMIKDIDELGADNPAFWARYAQRQIEALRIGNCPTELAEMAHLYPEFVKLGAEVCGVSTDSVYVHKAWHDHSPMVRSVEFPLIADSTGALSREFGVYVEEEGVALRGTFLIDPDGVLRACEIHDNSIGRQIGETLRKLQAAIRVRKGEGEACPANWQPGQSTLTPGLDLVGRL